MLAGLQLFLTFIWTCIIRRMQVCLRPIPKVEILQPEAWDCPSGTQICAWFQCWAKSFICELWLSNRTFSFHWVLGLTVVKLTVSPEINPSTSFCSLLPSGWNHSSYSVTRDWRSGADSQPPGLMQLQWLSLWI
jgi:hypothetical protein